MSKLVLATAILVCTLVGSVSADLIYSTTNPNRVVGITDLFVSATGRTYDVEFPDGSFLELFGEPSALTITPTFWQDETAAVSAQAAIMSQLNAANPIPNGLEDPANPIKLNFFAIPFDAVDPEIQIRLGHYFVDEGEWQNVNVFDRLKTSNPINENYAVFTEVAIPEPSASIVFGVMVSLFLSRRR